MSFMSGSEKVADDILVVDDAPANLKLLKEILNEAGYRVRLTTEGELALRSAKLQPPALILLDIRMPGMDGYEVCKHLKSDETTSSIPVIFLSALEDERDKLKAFEAGGVDYVTKPIHASEVLARIGIHLSLRHAQIELEERNAELEAIRATLEERVKERSADLERINARLQQEIEVHLETLDALKKSEEKYRSLIQKVPVAIVLHDSQGRVIDSNAVAHELLGLSSDQALKTDLNLSWRFLREDGSQMPLSEYPASLVLSTRQRLKDYVAGVNRPGRDSISWMLVNAEPEFNDAGEIQRIIVSFIDITERKHAQEKIAHLASIVETTGDAVIGKTLDEKIVSWNKGAEQIYGYTASEIMGRPVSLLVPEDRQEELENIMARLRAGETVEHFETARLRRDGQVIHVALTISPIRNTAGEIVGASTIARDITKRKQAEDALRRMNRELRAISTCNQVLMLATCELTLLKDICRIVCDEAGYRMAWAGYAENDEAKSVRPAAWAGNEDGYLATAAVNWADTERGRGPSGSAIRSGKTAVSQDLANDPQIAPWREDALLRGYRSSIALPLKDEDGRTFGCLTIYSAETGAFTPAEIALLEELAGDLAFGITALRTRNERNRAEAGLRQLNQELEQRVASRTAALEEAIKEQEAFSYTVSHDLRAPLRAIDGFARILQEEYASILGEEGRRYTETIGRNAVRMSQLISDILDFSRMSRREIAAEPVDMTELAREVYEEVRGAAPAERNIVLHMASLPPASGDRAMLRQVWVNLISNAVKFTSPQPEALIEVGSSAASGENTYWVKDNGVGFDMRYSDKLFGVFQRLHTADEFEGTGIGLAIVKRVVTRHGGRVWAESKLGKGTTLYFTLPATKEEQDHA
jgi:PAS domain S-box-containing protein